MLGDFYVIGLWIVSCLARFDKNTSLSGADLETARGQLASLQVSWAEQSPLLEYALPVSKEITNKAGYRRNR